MMILGICSIGDTLGYVKSWSISSSSLLIEMTVNGSQLETVIIALRAPFDVSSEHQFPSWCLLPHQKVGKIIGICHASWTLKSFPSFLENPGKKAKILKYSLPASSEYVMHLEHLRVFLHFLKILEKKLRFWSTPYQPAPFDLYGNGQLSTNQQQRGREAKKRGNRWNP